jgi:hypothetical protein
MITQNCQFQFFFPNHQCFCDKFQLHVAKNIELSLYCLIFYLYFIAKFN